MRPRRYPVDDCDFEEYRRQGGTMTPAQFFNAKLGGMFSDSAPLSKRLAQLLGDGVQPQTLSDRIKQNFNQG